MKIILVLNNFICISLIHVPTVSKQLIENKLTSQQMLGLKVSEQSLSEAFLGNTLNQACSTAEFYLIFSTAYIQF